MSESILWRNVTNAWVSGDGASGVIFVTVRQSDMEDPTVENTYVLKGSSKIAEEYFSTK